MFGLIPKEEKFFQMFQEMGDIIVEGAQELKEMLDDYTDPAASQKAIKDIEHRGDTPDPRHHQEAEQELHHPLRPGGYLRPGIGSG